MPIINIAKIKCSIAVIKRLILASLLVQIILGCTSIKPATEIINSSINDAKLLAISDWQSRGRMAFRSETENISASFRWVQNGDDFEYILTNTLGIRLLSITYKDSVATIVTDGKTYTGTDPEHLAFQVSGWRIPILSLRFWVRGLARRDDLIKRDTSGLLREITPSGSLNQWQATFSEFQQVDDLVLPRQMELNQPLSNVQIRLRINRWEFK